MPIKIQPPLSTLGVIGGLGPMASAEFVRTIYELSAGDLEQSLPQVILASDPTFPDRTEALLNGESALLLARLNQSIDSLLRLHCSHLVICCVTLHVVLPQLAPSRSRRLISLVDVLMDEIAARGERQLLFCSKGTRGMGIFERHPRWPLVERLVSMPGDEDQDAIHRFIYRIKRTGMAEPCIEAVGTLLDKYRASSLAVGCTEFHLLAKAANRIGAPLRTCDPLELVARNWVQQRRAMERSASGELPNAVLNKSAGA